MASINLAVGTQVMAQLNVEPEGFLHNSNMSPVMRTGWNHFAPHCKVYNRAEWQVLFRSRLLAEDIQSPRCHRCHRYYRTGGHDG